MNFCKVCLDQAKLYGRTGLLLFFAGTMAPLKGKLGSELQKGKKLVPFGRCAVLQNWVLGNFLKWISAFFRS